MLRAHNCEKHANDAILPTYQYPIKSRELLEQPSSYVVSVDTINAFKNSLDRHLFRFIYESFSLVFTFFIHREINKGRKLSFSHMNWNGTHFQHFLRYNISRFLWEIPMWNGCLRLSQLYVMAPYYCRHCPNSYPLLIWLSQNKSPKDRAAKRVNNHIFL